MASADAVVADHQPAPLPLLDQPFQSSQRLFLRGTAIKGRRLQRTSEGGCGEMPLVSYHSRECREADLSRHDELAPRFPLAA
jgi:hypothetical protein